MTSPIGTDDPTNICPYLGMVENADSHANYATDAHRCYRLDNPTRIAAGHQETFCLGATHPNCPVYQGKGVSAGGGRGAAASSQKPAEPKAPTPPRAPKTTPRPAPERPLQPGSIGGRARGISMPVATIGLFALAVVVILLAFWISSIVGGDDDDGISPADAQRTSLAARTPTPGASTPTTRPGTPSATPNAATRTAQGTGTAAATGTVTGTPATGTPGANGNTYTVVAGDICGTIADKNNITVEQLRSLNPSIDAECTNLQLGQQLRVR
ncbi:MAG: LysM peptidoglycan-binding domain-containing protein [Dehalococcoidia bacterium]